MMYDAYHHIENISNPAGEKKVYTVTGNICETDTFGSDRELNEVREGDRFMSVTTGANRCGMPSNYNARFKPAEVLIRDGKAQLIRKRDQMEDLLKNQIL